ncbi:MAG: hypothetical protein RLZZ373_2641 [Pseudomonadota bacterium]|jgi:hypothetical protein
MSTLGHNIIADPERVTCAPEVDDDCTSLQPLGDATALVCYSVGYGTVQVTGAFVGGEFVDRSEFSASRVEAWRYDIQREYDSERDGSFA